MHEGRPLHDVLHRNVQLQSFSTRGGTGNVCSTPTPLEILRTVRPFSASLTFTSDNNAFKDLDTFTRSFDNFSRTRTVPQTECRISVRSWPSVKLGLMDSFYSGLRQSWGATLPQRINCGFFVLPHTETIISDNFRFVKLFSLLFRNFLSGIKCPLFLQGQAMAQQWQRMAGWHSQRLLLRILVRVRSSSHCQRHWHIRIVSHD